MFTPSQAYNEASQWGSYLCDGDPGACFYAFHTNDGRPVSEAHRRQCLDYTRVLLVGGADSGLEGLLEFFAATPLYGGEG